MARILGYGVGNTNGARSFGGKELAVPVVGGQLILVGADDLAPLVTNVRILVNDELIRTITRKYSLLLFFMGTYTLLKQLLNG